MENKKSNKIIKKANGRRYIEVDIPDQESYIFKTDGKKYAEVDILYLDI